jgi:dUTP pyrophosphatase
MKKFYCNGKRGFCDDANCECCEFENGEGGGYIEVPETPKMKVMLDPGAIMPTRAHSTDAGLDLYSPFEFILKQSTGRDFVTLDGIPVKAGCRTVDTGVHVEIPVGYVGMIKSKSGLNVKYGILSEGVIGAGYTGSICVKLYNLGESDVYIGKGQKISQLVILPIITPELELVDSLDETERGDGGFGSTGKF